MQIEGSPLSEREEQVARILLQGKSNKQIASELGISNRTVEFHLGNIYSKLGVASRTEAVLKLRESRLWETAGLDQGKSTVDGSGDRNENDMRVISRRITMKKLFHGFGILLAAALIANLVLASMRGEAVNPTPVVPTSTTIAETSPTTEPVPTQASEPERVVIPPHTVNGYTATIESYSVDISHVIFQVRLTGNDIDPDRKLNIDQFGSMDIYDEYGNLINSSGGLQAATDQELVQFSFVPVTLFKGDRFKGQFAFNLNAGYPDYNQILAKFRFDVDLPVYPEVRFYPKQTVTANGLNILVDSVTVTPVFTQVYMCFEPPSQAPWLPGNGTVIKIAGQEALLYNSSELFSSFIGSYWGIQSEPYWVPPVKNGVCHKMGFQAGTSTPTQLTLTIPDLENLMPYVQTDPSFDLFDLYPGLNKRQAFHTYLEENGSTHKGPWIFNIDLVP